MRNPLDPDYVPFTCAVVSALCGKPTLMEEFGGCTAPPGAPSQVWNWQAYGKPRTQFMASEEDLADYYAAVLPKLVEVGATGAMLWCFADYSSDLWNEPPCDEARHERFFKNSRLRWGESQVLVSQMQIIIGKQGGKFCPHK